MFIRLLRSYSVIIKPIEHSFWIENRTFRKSNIQSCFKTQILIHQSRPASFFTKYTSKFLWKSVLSVSNPGKTRGRGKGRKWKVNFNIGQKIGVGKVPFVWPGLNSPVLQNSNIVKPKKIGDSQNLEENILANRERNQVRGLYKRIHPLLRGWTSSRLGGKNIGIPNKKEKYFEDFESRMIEHKLVMHMTGCFGRRRFHSCFTIVGNKLGLCGFALGKSSDINSAIRISTNRALNKIIFVPMYNNHTVYHDFFTQFGNTKIFVSKKPEGYGLVCHRAIKCACEVIGIKDLYAKVEGAINYQHIIKAFILGLLRQKTHQQLAEEKKLHLVEFRKENLMYPKVVASPATVRTSAEVSSTEMLDFTQYVLGGKVVLQKKKYLPFYINFPSYKNKQRKMEYLRNQDQVRIQIYAKYGELRSFLTDKYPEAKPQLWKKIKKIEEEN